MNERFASAERIARVDLAHEREFDLGPLRIRPAMREVSVNGRGETLEPRVMQVLVALARAKGEVVSRDDLIQACWEGRIVNEDAISRCIAQLRKLAEANGNAFAIETVARVGYRLKVGNSDGRWVSDKGQPIKPAAAQRLDSPSSDSRRKAAVITAGALALILGGIGLWRFWPAAPAGQPATSVAVLPFANVGDATKEYLSDGFSEELLNDLSNNPRLKVPARISSFAFKGRNVDARTVGHALGVASIVEGTVREAGNRVQISAQLIDSGTGYSIWSASYNRSLADILSVQDDVARAISHTLTDKLAPAAPRWKIDPEIYRLYLQARHQKLIPGDEPPRVGISPAVYRLYLEGHRAYERDTLESRTKACEQLKEVVARQPNFADGYAALALAEFSLATLYPLHKTAYLADSDADAAKALSLDPRNIEARVARAAGEVDAWNWKSAASDLRILQAESPNNVRVLRALRIFYFEMGFPDLAISMQRQVLRIDPSDYNRSEMLWYLIHMNHSTEAITLARTLLAHQPHNIWALSVLCSANAGTRHFREAQHDRLELLQLHTDTPTLSSCDFDIDYYTGQIDNAQTILAAWASMAPDKISAAEMAEGYALLGEFDKARGWSERSYEAQEMLFFQDIYWPDAERYHRTKPWTELTLRPGFKEWQAEHDRIAAALRTHRDPLQAAAQSK